MPEIFGVHVVASDSAEIHLPAYSDFDNVISANNLEQLSVQQQSELLELLSEFRNVFSDKPGRTQYCVRITLSCCLALSVYFAVLIACLLIKPNFLKKKLLNC
jgi:hypothetical protein